MGLRARIATDINDFKRGFNEAVGEDVGEPLTAEVTSALDRAVAITASAIRVVLFGYLLAFPGVPMLPWGRTALMFAAIGAWVVSALPLGKHPARQFVRLAIVAILGGASLKYGVAPSTSMVLIGALVSAAASTAQNSPAVYGIVSGYTAAALLSKAFDWQLFESKQLPLSGRPFNVDDAATEAMRLAGLMFLAGLMHFSRFEIERLRSKAKDAEAARDAAVVDERARIARELHDVVSHHVTAMTLQAEAAAMTGDKQALASVASAGRDALTELRRMLGVLRHPDDGAPNALSPQPGLDALDGLAARASTGPTVRIERRGEARGLSAGLELGVYRLVQEAITNSTKHGDATTVDVVLTYAETALTVDVVDNGRPFAAARVGSGGLGLVGMQERIALLNGELSAGPRSDGTGYRVHASLPLDA